MEQWRTQQGSNLWPLASETNTLSNWAMGACVILAGKRIYPTKERILSKNRSTYKKMHPESIAKPPYISYNSRFVFF